MPSSSLVYLAEGETDIELELAITNHCFCTVSVIVILQSLATLVPCSPLVDFGMHIWRRELLIPGLFI